MTEPTSACALGGHLIPCCPHLLRENPAPGCCSADYHSRRQVSLLLADSAAAQEAESPPWDLELYRLSAWCRTKYERGLFLKKPPLVKCNIYTFKPLSAFHSPHSSSRFEKKTTPSNESHPLETFPGHLCSQSLLSLNPDETSVVLSSLVIRFPMLT